MRKSRGGLTSLAAWLHTLESLTSLSPAVVLLYEPAVGVNDCEVICLVDQECETYIIRRSRLRLVLDVGPPSV